MIFYYIFTAVNSWQFEIMPMDFDPVSQIMGQNPIYALIRIMGQNGLSANPQIMPMDHMSFNCSDHDHRPMAHGP